MAIFAHARDAQAQGIPQNKAGVVIDFGGGSVYTACVDLGTDGQATGEELLHAAGFDVLIEYSSQGGAVCRIGAQGCNYPDQNCWCQCMSSPCVYWAYNHLAGSQWLYSALGASSYVVHSGEVDGWAWGAGTVAQGAQPPVYTFDQICAPPTATPTPTATWTPIPTLTPTTAATIWVPWPTSTPAPTAASAGTATPTWTPNPTATPTPTWTASPLPTPTPDPFVTSTVSPVPTATFTSMPAIVAGTPAPTGVVAPTPGTLAQNTVSPGPAAAVPPGQMYEQTMYLPFVQSGADGAATISAGAPSAPVAGVITATLAPTTTLAAALPASPAGGAAVHLTSARAVDKTSNEEVSWLQNAPFSAEAEAARVTQAAPDPVWPALLVLLLAGVLAALRYLRRVGVRSAALDLSPRAVSGALAGSVAGLQRHRGASAGRGASLAGAPSGLLSLGVYGLTAGIGLLALLQPFLSAALGNSSAGTNGASAPLLITILLALCFLALLFEVQGQAVSAKMIALLGVLVAINSVLRFVEVSIPGPGGFTPVFFLIVLTGYVFGGRFGFLMGALTMLVSGLITGGVGPWLPGQMFTAGWMGLLAPLARPLVRLVGGRPGSLVEVSVLAGYAGLCGLFYGVVINLWFWPFMTGPSDQYWQAGVGLAATVSRYAVYYAATSLIWDAFAVAGNLLLVGVFGAATLRALRRFHQRFDFEYRPVDVVAQAVAVVELPDKPVASLAKPGPAMALSEGRGRA